MPKKSAPWGVQQEEQEQQEQYNNSGSKSTTAVAVLAPRASTASAVCAGVPLETCLESRSFVYRVVGVKSSRVVIQ